MKQNEPVIHSDPDIMGGTPVFVGTCVPLATLLDCLEAGHPCPSTWRTSRPLPGNRP
jgi:uncharacterized protein (DUF433 family)